MNTEATTRFLGTIADDDSLWYNANQFTTDALKKAGLPSSRKELRKLVKSMRD